MKIVTFTPPCSLPPLITNGTLADDIERYLQRAISGPLAVHIDDDHGRALDGARTVAAFTVADFGPLGGEA